MADVRPLNPEKIALLRERFNTDHAQTVGAQNNQSNQDPTNEKADALRDHLQRQSDNAQDRGR